MKMKAKLAANRQRRLAAAELSFEQVRMLIQDQLAERFGRHEYGGPRCWVRELFPEFALVEKEGKLYRVSYTVDGADVTVGELQEVLPEYVPVESSEVAAKFDIDLQLAGESKPSDEQGLVWEFLVLLAGAAEVFTDAGLQFYFTKEFVREQAAAFDGAHAYADHAKGTVGSIRNVVGFWSDVKVKNDGQEAYATLNLFEAEDDLRKKMLSAWKAKRPQLIGASVKATVDGEVKVIGGKKYFAPTKVDLTTPRSIDLVPVGAVSGAGMVRLVASKEVPRQSAAAEVAGAGGGTQQKEKLMEKLIAVMLAAIMGWNATRAAALKNALTGMKDDDPKRLEHVTEVYIECANGQFARFNSSAGEGALAEIAEARKQVEATVAESKKVLTELQAAAKDNALANCKAVLRASLADSRLPVSAQKDIERRFADRVFSEDELKKECEAVRELLASVAPDTRVAFPVVTMGLDQYDKLQIALDKTFGLKKDPKGADLPTEIPAFKGLRHAYVEFTGDAEVTGKPNQARLSAILNNAGFPSALANTMTRALLMDYKAVDYRWREITSSISSPDNFKTQERIRVGYFGDLATVDPEAADYAELAAFTDEKVSYAVIQKGNIVTVTRKAIINDDLAALSKVVGRLGRAAARTLAKRVWNKVVNNDAYDVDGVALFHATHNNLGSSALGVTALNAAALLVYNQTEKDSNEKLALDVYTLVVPRNLWEVAFGINQSEKFNSGPGIEEANPWHHKFGANNERIITLPLTADVNDWYLFANPADVDILEVGFLQGRQDPEFFLADAVPAEQVFVADKVRYKVRHEYEAEILDFRGAFKAVVP